MVAQTLEVAAISSLHSETNTFAKSFTKSMVKKHLISDRNTGVYVMILSKVISLFGRCS